MYMCISPPCICVPPLAPRLAPQVQNVRKQKLEALFLNDEIKYEEELAQMGLAYRRIRA